MPSLNIYELHVAPIGAVTSAPLTLPAGFMGFEQHERRAAWRNEPLPPCQGL